MWPVQAPRWLGHRCCRSAKSTARLRCSASTMASPCYGESEIRGYLGRIGFGGSQQLYEGPLPRPTAETLVGLHRCHALTIPFENLSLVHPALLGDVPIDHASLYRKMVLLQRGGWCFEANGLLSGMMQSLGFNLYESSARVVRQGTLVPAAAPFEGLVTSSNSGSTFTLTARSHRIVLAQLSDGCVYLCDVGFGGQGLLEPIPLQAYDDQPHSSINDSGRSSSAPSNGSALQEEPLKGHPSNLHGGSSSTDGRGGAPPNSSSNSSGGSPAVLHQAGTSFRVRRGVVGSAEHLPSSLVPTHPERHSHVGWYLQCLLEGAWTDLYYFTLEASSQADFEVQSFYTQHRHSLFTNTYVVTVPTLTGRHTLVDYLLKTRAAGQPTQERQLHSDAERDEVLLQLFNIDVGAKVA